MNDSKKEVTVKVHYLVTSNNSADSINISPEADISDIKQALKERNPGSLGKADDISIKITITKEFYSFIKKQQTNSITEEDEDEEDEEDEEDKADKLTVASHVQAKVISDLQALFLSANPKKIKKRCLQVSYPHNKNNVQVQQQQQPNIEISQLLQLLRLERHKCKIISNWSETNLSPEGSNHVSSVCGNDQFVSQLTYVSNALFLLPRVVDMEDVIVKKNLGKRWTKYVKNFLEDDCQKALEIAKTEHQQLNPFNIFNVQGCGSIHLVVPDDFGQQRQLSCTLGDYAVLAHQKTQKQMFTDLSSKETVMSSLLVCIESQSSPKNFHQALAQLSLTLTLHLRKGTIQRGYGILCGYMQNEAGQSVARMQVVKCDPYDTQPIIYNGMYPMKASNFISILLAILEKIKE